MSVSTVTVISEDLQEVIETYLSREVNPSVKPAALRHYYEGRTSSVRSHPSYEEFLYLGEDLGLPSRWVLEWASMVPPSSRIDLLATILLLMDTATAERTLKGQTILTPWMLCHRHEREIVMDAERVEWIWSALGHTSLCWGSASPEMHSGTNREWRIDQYVRNEIRSEAQRAADEQRAITHYYIDRALRS